MEQTELELKQVEEKTAEAKKQQRQAQRAAKDTTSKTTSSDIKKKITTLEAQIKQLTSENAALKQKQDQTNSSINDYISEMSSMLTQAELDSAMNLDNYDSAEEDVYANDQQMLDEIDMEDEALIEQNRLHAGTGGSSKLRSRPQQVAQIVTQGHR